MTAAMRARAGRPNWPATAWLLLGAFGWSAFVLADVLIAALQGGFDLTTLVGAAPMALWVSAAGWVAYGARTPARAPNLVPIALCGLASLVAMTSFIAALVVVVSPTAVALVVAAALNLSRWPR